jgi:hypothetical protein
MDQKQIMSKECNAIRCTSIQNLEVARASLHHVQRKQLRTAKMKMAAKLEKVKTLRIQNAGKILQGDAGIEKLTSWSKLTADTDFSTCFEQRDASGNKEMNARFGRLNNLQPHQAKPGNPSPFSFKGSCRTSPMDIQQDNEEVSTILFTDSNSAEGLGDTFSVSDRVKLNASKKSTRRLAQDRWLKEPVKMLSSHSSPQLMVGKVPIDVQQRTYESKEARRVHQDTQRLLSTMQTRSSALTTIQSRKLAKRKTILQGKSTMLVAMDSVLIGDPKSDVDEAPAAIEQPLVRAEDGDTDTSLVAKSTTEMPVSTACAHIAMKHTGDRKRSLYLGGRRTIKKLLPSDENLLERLQTTWNALEVSTETRLDFAVAHSESAENALQLSSSVCIWENLLAIVNALTELRALESKAPAPWMSSMLSAELKKLLVENSASLLPADYAFISTTEMPVSTACAHNVLTAGKAEEEGGTTAPATRIMLAFESADVLQEVIRRAEAHGLEFIHNNTMLAACPRMRNLVKGVAACK